MTGRRNDRSRGCFPLSLLLRRWNRPAGFTDFRISQKIFSSEELFFRKGRKDPSPELPAPQELHFIVRSPPRSMPKTCALQWSNCSCFLFLNYDNIFEFKECIKHFYTMIVKHQSRNVNLFSFYDLFNGVNSCQLSLLYENRPGAAFAASGLFSFLSGKNDQTGTIVQLARMTS